MPLITAEDFTEFNEVINDALESFSTKTLLWYRKISNLSDFMEDTGDLGNMQAPPIAIPVLCNYNYMRSWPITRNTDAGEVDKQSVQILISKKWLNSNGYLTNEGYFNYSPSLDRFRIDGLVHKSQGDTLVSQSNTDLIFSMILTREETTTGNKR